MSHDSERRVERLQAGLLLLLSFPLIFWGLGSYGLVNGDEEIYHVIAAAMVESGNWLHLDFYGEHRVYDTFMNAPIQYWARAILIAVFGDNFWTMRLWSAVFAAASVLLTHRVVLENSDRRSALLAGLVQLTTLQFVYLHSARTGELEPVLAFLFTAIAWTFCRALTLGRSFVPHHLCIAILLQLKLPMALIPLFAAGLCFAVLPTARAEWRRWLWAGVRVLPLGLVWHVSQVIMLWGPFVEVVSRMGEQAASGVSGQRLLPGELAGFESTPLRNLGFYLGTLLYGAFPYVLVYPLALFAVLRRAGRGPHALFWRVLALHGLALLIFYVFVGKHHRWYLMPLYPLLSGFVGHWLAGLWRREVRPLGVVVIALVLAACAWLTSDAAGLNPFAQRAYLLPMELGWRHLGDAPPWLGLLATGIVFAAGLLVLGRLRPALARTLLPIATAVVLVATGAARVVLPLRHLGYRSEMARFHADVVARQSAGSEVEFPVTAPVRANWETRFYFDPAYEVVRESDQSFRVYERGDPRAERDRRRTFVRTVREQRATSTGSGPEVSP